MVPRIIDEGFVEIDCWIFNCCYWCIIERFYTEKSWCATAEVVSRLLWFKFKLFLLVDDDCKLDVALVLILDEARYLRGPNNFIFSLILYELSSVGFTIYFYLSFWEFIEFCMNVKRLIPYAVDLLILGLYSLFYC